MHHTPDSVISYILPGHRDVSKMKIKFVSGSKSVKKGKKRKKESPNSSDDAEIYQKKAYLNIVISSGD